MTIHYYYYHYSSTFCVSATSLSLRARQPGPDRRFRVRACSATCSPCDSDLKLISLKWFDKHAPVESIANRNGGSRCSRPHSIANMPISHCTNAQRSSFDAHNAALYFCISRRFDDLALHKLFAALRFLLLLSIAIATVFSISSISVRRLVRFVECNSTPDFISIAAHTHSKRARSLARSGVCVFLSLFVYYIHFKWFAAVYILSTFFFLSNYSNYILTYAWRNLCRSTTSMLLLTTMNAFAQSKIQTKNHACMSRIIVVLSAMLNVDEHMITTATGKWHRPLIPQQKKKHKQFHSVAAHAEDDWSKNMNFLLVDLAVIRHSLEPPNSSPKRAHKFSWVFFIFVSFCFFDGTVVMMLLLFCEYYYYGLGHYYYRSLLLKRFLLLLLLLLLLLSSLASFASFARRRRVRRL